MALQRVRGPITRESFLHGIASLGTFTSGDFLVNYTPAVRTSMRQADVSMISGCGKLVR